MNREYIAYEGQEFTIEWYYDVRGKSQALEYYEALSQQEKKKLLYLFKRMGDAGKIMDKTKFNNEGDQIYAFKPQPDRFLCFFFEGKKIVVTNGFCKKKQKLPSNEKDTASKSKKDYELRVKRGDYYD
jgi:phage-related protein